MRKRPAAALPCTPAPVERRPAQAVARVDGRAPVQQQLDDLRPQFQAFGIPCAPMTKQPTKEHTAAIVNKSRQPHALADARVTWTFPFVAAQCSGWSPVASWRVGLAPARAWRKGLSTCSKANSAAVAVQAGSNAAPASSSADTQAILFLIAARCSAVTMELSPASRSIPTCARYCSARQGAWRGCMLCAGRAVMLTGVHTLHCCAHVVWSHAAAAAAHLDDLQARLLSGHVQRLRAQDLVLCLQHDVRRVAPACVARMGGRHARHRRV